MDLKLLGTVEMAPWTKDGELGRYKERCLLAVLGLAAGQVVSTDTLISKVWDDDAPSQKVRNTLRSYVAHVKRAVAATGGASVESGRGGYVLRIDRENVDVHRFDRLVAQAGAIAGNGDVERAVSLLREADGLWRDDALAGLPGRRIEAIRHGLGERRRLAVERRVAWELSLGRHAELITELWEWIERFSHAERWISFQMRALFCAGREEDALALFQRDYARRDELGLHPSPALAELQGRILRRDPALRVASPERRPARRASRDGGLPPRPEAIVGRDRELAALCGVSDAATPVVRGIDGMPGTGKTALAVEAAHRLGDRYPDPPLFVTFHAHQTGQSPLGARDALCRLLENAGAMPEVAPQAMSELVAIWQREAANRRSVIVLDDVPDVGALTGILPAAGESAVIVTSRPRLSGLPATVVLTLEELTSDDAIMLFTRTAGAPKSDDLAAITRAVQICGCLPLALILSASRLRDGRSTVAEFVADAEERHAFPDHVDLVIPGLAETFEGSYADLDPEHRRFFRRLGMNPCPDFSPSTAAVLVGTTAQEAESTLQVLHNRRLIQPAAVGRFKFHDLLREYAVFVAERDDPRWERRRAVHRLLRYYLDSARSADGKWFELEWRNIVRLADYASRHEWKEYCADLSEAVAAFLDSSGYWIDGINLHQTALRSCRDLGDPLRIARTAKSLSRLEARTGNYRDALTHIGESVEIFRSVEDGNGIAGSLDQMGIIHSLMGQPRMALAHHQEAIEIYRNIQDKSGIASGLCNAGFACHDLGRYVEAIAYDQNARALYSEMGDRFGEVKCLNNVGDVLCDQGLFKDAAPYLEEGLDICQEIDARQHLAALRLNMGHVAQSKGRHKEAITSYRAALVACRESGDLRHAAGALCDIGDTYQIQEHYDKALIHYEEAEVIAEKMGDIGLRGIVSLGIADVLSGSGNYSRALERYEVVLELALQGENLLRKAKALEGMAETRFRMRDVAKARILLREAADAYEIVGVPDAARVRLRLSMLDAQAC